jgi:CTP-dependent riboflavin kinase
LILGEEGKLIGSFDGIGAALGTSGKTIRNWVDHLESKGVISKTNKGRQVEIQLKGTHLLIATSPDRIEQAQNIKPDYSPRTQSLINILAEYEKLGVKVQIIGEGI